MVPLPHSSVSHDSSEIILKCWFGDQQHFLLLSTLTTFVVLYIFVEFIFFSGFIYDYKVNCFIKVYIYIYIVYINVLQVTIFSFKALKSVHIFSVIMYL